MKCNLAAGILYQNIDVGLLPSSSPLPLPLWDVNAINHPSLTALDHSLLNSNDFNKFSTFGYPTTTLYGTVKAPSDLLDNSLLNYYHNGRFLKQYFVMEDNFDDLNELNNFLGRYMPFVPANYNVPPASSRPNLGFPIESQQPPPTQSISNLNYFSLPQRQSPVPIQLGSGSLGFIRAPNGGIYLGSGSLGYIDDKTKFLQLNEARNRQSPQASPTHFGETPR